jgi:phosphate acetyltransferase/phosphate butyryltransferase
MVNAYADISGDRNPIHLDPAFAAGTQFGGIVAHGMVLYGFMCDAMRHAHPDAWESTGRMRARFRDPARPGDVITVTGILSGSGTVEAEDSTIVRYSLECKESDGRVLATGNAEVTIASHGSSAGERSMGSEERSVDE